MPSVRLPGFGRKGGQGDPNAQVIPEPKKVALAAPVERKQKKRAKAVQRVRVPSRWRILRERSRADAQLFVELLEAGADLGASVGPILPTDVIVMSKRQAKDKAYPGRWRERREHGRARGRTRRSFR